MELKHCTSSHIIIYFDSFPAKSECLMYPIYHLEKYWEMSSLGETTVKKLITSYPEEFVNHNKTFLTRVYPSGKRVDSSNYNPVEMWNYGCQMG